MPIEAIGAWPRGTVIVIDDQLLGPEGHQFRSVESGFIGLRSPARGGPVLPQHMAGWLEELRTGAATARYVADELDKVIVGVERHQAKFATCEFPQNLAVTELGQCVLNQIADGDQ